MQTGQALSQDEDYRKMELGEDELLWAHEIKAAINNSPNLNNITDYECAQWAIISMQHQDLDDILDRAYRLQCFREQYKVHQNPNFSYAEEGLATLQGLMDFMPGFFLSLDYIASQGHYVFVTDKAKFFPGKVYLEKDWKHLIAGSYFMFEIMCSNFQATRHGVGWINECMGMGFHNYSASVEERWTSDIVYFYPMIGESVMWLNTPTVANVLFACLKPFLREEQASVIHVGCKLPGYEGERIDQLFLQPTPEAARESLEKRLYIYLMERQTNLLSYKLPERPVSADVSLAQELLQAPSDQAIS